eukprot:1649599-Pyramimonas_sp.AAC.1
MSCGRAAGVPAARALSCSLQARAAVRPAAWAGRAPGVPAPAAPAAAPRHGLSRLAPSAPAAALAGALSFAGLVSEE